MREFRHFGDRGAGSASPLSGPLAPVMLGLLTLLSACSGTEREESLPILQVGMTDTMESIYDDGELQMYEVKKGMAFPILAPDATTRAQLDEEATEPYGSRPWVTTDNIDVQVNFTISNLDDESHIVQMLVDPWNEFGRYYPGLQLTDPDNEEYMPNFSAIDRRYIVPGKGAGEASRVHGTYTFAELEETANDLATVMGLLADPPPVEEDEEDPSVNYANHAFYAQNRSSDDPLVAQWLPKVVAGLTGLDIGFRTYEKANVAIEVAVELVDKKGDRVRREGESKPLLEPTDAIITVGVAPP